VTELIENITRNLFLADFRGNSFVIFTANSGNRGKHTFTDNHSSKYIIFKKKL